MHHTGTPQNIYRDCRRVGIGCCAGSLREIATFPYSCTGLRSMRELPSNCCLQPASAWILNKRFSGLPGIYVLIGGRLLFAATSKGTVRTYRLPLSQDFQELHCSSSPITQLALSHSFTHLYASSSEGLLFVFAVKDRDPSRLASRDTHEDQLPWSDEVLLSTSSIEEKHQRIASLESQVAHLLFCACGQQMELSILAKTTSNCSDQPTCPCRAHLLHASHATLQDTHTNVLVSFRGCLRSLSTS